MSKNAYSLPEDKRFSGAMKRRGFITLAGGALAWATAARAQQVKRVSRIGLFLPPPRNSEVDAFLVALRGLGWVEGENVHVEYRDADGDDNRLPALAAELVALGVDVLVTATFPGVLAAHRATTTIPTVMIVGPDLVTLGLAASMAHPGGNITGQTIIAPDVTGKRLELLREVVPSLNRVAILWNPDNPVSVPELKETEAAARLLGLQLQSFGVNNPDGFRSAFASMTKERAEALVVFSDAMFFGERKQIADLATRNRLPAISWTSEFAKSGGLMGYGPDALAISRRAATYVDKILKGATPGDLPIEQPTKFDFVVNLKTARTLGLTIPQSFLLRASDVIQ